MDFGLYLPCYWPDTTVPMHHMYREMVEEARFAEELGFVSFTVPEHHFSNALVHPSPLLTAVRVASATRHVPIITATSVLPFHDMRRLAGEIAQADCLTGGRIGVGVGRGAYAYEFDRFEVSREASGDIFRESLQVLIRLLEEEDVEFEGEFYNFPATTITPRPVQKPRPPIWFAGMTEGGIDYAVSLGLPVLTTPLREGLATARMQAGAFRDSVTKRDAPHLKLSMLLMLFVTTDDRQVERMVEHAMGRHRRFTNVFTTSGEVRGGAIVPHDVDVTLEEIERNLIIGPPSFCAEKLAEYAALEIDNIQVNMNFGASHAEVMGSLESFATRVIPQFA